MLRMALAIGTLAAVCRLDAQQPDLGMVPLRAACRYATTVGSPSERLLDAIRLANGGKNSFLGYSGWEPSLGCAAQLGRPFVALSVNTTTATSTSDGALWQGKGANGAASIEASREWRRLSLQLRPVMVFSQNLPYAARVRPASANDFRNEDWPNQIDLPFRFGDRPLAQVHFGESTVQIAARKVRGGISTASQSWGPARHYPLLVGTDGPGYPRIFLEGRELSTIGGRLTAHWQFGILEASRWSDLAAGQRSRLSSAFMASYTPKWLPVVTLGGGRFFHIRREPGAINFENAILPFTGILKSNSVDASVGGFNQLASAMLSVSPGAGVEVFGELLRDDHNSTLRDLIAEPDHASAYVIGIRRARRTSEMVELVTIEAANSRFSHVHRIRPQAPVLTHSSIAEGHTHLGQSIGSSVLPGGGGLVFAVERARDRVSTHGSIEIRQERQKEEGGTWDGRPSSTASIRLGRRFMRSNQTLGFAARYQIGIGVGSRSNLTVSTDWSP
jgi:hypothetical protein